MERANRKRAADDASPKSPSDTPTHVAPLDVVWRERVVKGLCFIACVVYINSINGAFTVDDYPVVVDNPDVIGSNPITKIWRNDYWGQPLASPESHKNFRPLVTLSFRLTRMFFGLRPFFYHITNIALHVQNTKLFLQLVELLMFPKGRAKAFLIASISALLFATHPIHTEAVSSIIGRSDLMAAFFFFHALLAYTRCATIESTDYHELARACAYAALSMLCKENGITVVGMFVAYDLLCVHRDTWWWYLHGTLHKKQIRRMYGRFTIICFFSSLLLSWRFWRNGGVPALYPREDNMATLEDGTTRTLTWNFLIAFNAWLLLFPLKLMANYSFDTIPLISDFNDVRNVFTSLFYIVFVLGTIFACYRAFPKSKRYIGTQNVYWLLALLFMVVPFVPCTNLFFPVGHTVAERVLYIPSAGFCMMVALVLDALHSSKRMKLNNVVAVAAVIAAMYGLRSFVRNGDWRTTFALSESMFKVHPTSPKAYNSLGFAWSKFDDGFEDAVGNFKAAIELSPTYGGAYNNLGKAYASANQNEDAARAFQYALQASPLNVETRMQLASIYGELNLWDDAADEYDRVLELQPTKSDAYYNLGVTLYHLNEFQDSSDALVRVIEDEPYESQPLVEYGKAQAQLGNADEAARAFTHALSLDPTNGDARSQLDAMGGGSETHTSAGAGAGTRRQPRESQRVVDEGNFESNQGSYDNNGPNDVANEDWEDDNGVTDGAGHSPDDDWD